MIEGCAGRAGLYQQNHKGEQDMTKEELLAIIADEAASFAKSQALAMLAELNTTELESIVQAQIKSLIEPLQEEIDSTESVWVKIRNRLYIVALNGAVSVIVKNVQDGIAGLIEDK